MLARRPRADILCFTVRRQVATLTLTWTLCVVAASAAHARAAPGAARKLGQAHEAYRDGRYDAALALAAPLTVAGKLHNTDYALHIAAQSAFYTGAYERALDLFTRLAGMKASRFAALASWRAADALWELGRTEGARVAYSRLLGKSGGDDGLARYRIGAAWLAARLL